MRFADLFIKKNFVFLEDKPYVTKNAIEFLLHQDFNVSTRIINSIPYVSIDSVSSKLGWSNKDVQKITTQLRYTLDQDRKKEVIHEDDSEFRTELKRELLREILKSEKYALDFKSYGFSNKSAGKKAITLSAMKVVQHFIKKYGRMPSIYFVIVEFPIKTGIKCSTAKQFYKYVRWLDRIGIFKGVLLGRQQLNKRLWKT